MGEATAQTVREIEQARERMSGNIRRLEERLPSPAVWGKRAIGVLAGGGASGSAVWFVIRRARKQRMKKKVRPAQVQTVVQLLPERWVQKLEDGNMRSWAAGLGTAMVLLEMAELRRLRALNKALAATRT